MPELPQHLHAEIWLDQFFGSTIARQGGVVKRKVRDVERIVGREQFVFEVNRRGFRAYQNGQHFIVFCNMLPITRVK